MTQTADAFRTLYAANHERVRRVLARLVGPQEAEDLAQTVFAKAAKALPTFRGDADASTWLHRISANVASDWLHSRSTHRSKVIVPLPSQSDDDTGVAALGATDVDGGPSAEQLLSSKKCATASAAKSENFPRPFGPSLCLTRLVG